MWCTFSIVSIGDQFSLTLFLLKNQLHVSLTIETNTYIHNHGITKYFIFLENQKTIHFYGDSLKVCICVYMLVCIWCVYVGGEPLGSPPELH